MTAGAVGFGVCAARVMEPFATLQNRMAFRSVAHATIGFLPFLPVAFKAGKLAVFAALQSLAMALGAVAHTFYGKFAMGDPLEGFGMATNLTHGRLL